MKEIIYKQNENLRLDSFLLESYPLLRSGVVNKFIRENKIKVNDKKLPPTTRLIMNDKIKLYISDDYFLKPNAENAFLFSSKSLEIVYEDDNILIVDKPSGISVIDESNIIFDTLINRVIHHYHYIGNSLSFTPQLCHRLDTGTSGIVIIGKTKAAVDFMYHLFKDKAIEKHYIAFVFGKPSKATLTADAYLNKNSTDSYVSISLDKQSKDSKYIQTGIKLIESRNEYSLLDITLITGRTHQIRAHLAFLKMPILGDSRYGLNNLNRKFKLKYQLLASYKIKFPLIEDSDFKYLSNKEFTAKDPWFLKSFYNNEFI